MELVATKHLEVAHGGAAAREKGNAPVAELEQLVPDLILELHGWLSRTRDSHDATSVTLRQGITMRSRIYKLVFTEPTIEAEHAEPDGDAHWCIPSNHGPIILAIASITFL